MRITEENVVPRQHVAAIEALLPFLFNVRGAGETAAQDAAESLLEFLDTLDLNVPCADNPASNVIMFRGDPGGAS